VVIPVIATDHCRLVSTLKEGKHRKFDFILQKIAFLVFVQKALAGIH